MQVNTFVYFPSKGDITVYKHSKLYWTRETKESFVARTNALLVGILISTGDFCVIIAWVRVTAAPGLVPCNWVMSSSANVLAIHLVIFSNQLSSFFTLEIRVSGCYSWHTNFSITATALDVGCAVVSRSVSAIDRIFFSFKKCFPTGQLSSTSEASR